MAVKLKSKREVKGWGLVSGTRSCGYETLRGLKQKVAWSINARPTGKHDVSHANPNPLLTFPNQAKHLCIILTAYDYTHFEFELPYFPKSLYIETWASRKGKNSPKSIVSYLQRNGYRVTIRAYFTRVIIAADRYDDVVRYYWMPPTQLPEQNIDPGLWEIIRDEGSLKDYKWKNKYFRPPAPFSYRYTFCKSLTKPVKHWYELNARTSDIYIYDIETEELWSMPVSALHYLTGSDCENSSDKRSYLDEEFNRTALNDFVLNGSRATVPQTF